MSRISIPRAAAPHTTLRTALLAVLALIATSPVSAQQARPAAPLPNIVLVHGAWADASSWSQVISRLQAAGYHVQAVQLAMQSLDADVATTRAVLARQKGPTLLVAHSFGGAIITQLGADAPNVIGLAYESAFAPDQGETMKAIITQGPQPAGAAAIRPDPRGNLWLDETGFLRFFAPDSPTGRARVLEAVQKPIAAGEFLGEEPFGPPAWRSFPTWYLVTTRDQMIPPAAQELFAGRMGATIERVAGSHTSMVSRPEAVAGFIMRAARAATSHAESMASGK